jgi:hypothetical protein
MEDNPGLRDEWCHALYSALQHIMSRVYTDGYGTYYIYHDGHKLFLPMSLNEALKNADHVLMCKDGTSEV